MHPLPCMRRPPLLIIAWTTVVCGCGGAVASEWMSQGSDGGSSQTTSSAGATTSVTATSASTSTMSAGTSTAGCTISTTFYDQSCTLDTDCVLVTTGNYCGAPNCLCETGTINASASSAFNAAVAQTPVGSGAVRAGDCPCAEAPGPCCRQGQCSTNCQSPSDTLAACSNLGGTCSISPPNNSACVAGSTSSAPLCAYSDEKCCMPAMPMAELPGH